MAGSARTNMVATHGAEMTGTIESDWGEDVNVTLDAKSMWNADNAAVTRRMAVNPFQFNMAASDSQWSLVYNPATQQSLKCTHTGDSNTYTAFAPVSLPDGVTISQLCANKGSDGGTRTGDIALGFFANTYGTAFTPIIYVDGYATGWGSECTSTVTYEVIDNDNRNYCIRAECYSTQTDNAYIFQVEIGYTVKRPQP